MKTLPVLHVADVCKVAQGSSTCRYLGNIKGEELIKHYCLKTDKHRATIDAEYARYVRQCEEKKIDLAELGVALGDNCEGYALTG